MEDDELIGQVKHRQLGAEDDLEMEWDHDLQAEEEELKSKVVFSVQSLGGVRAISKNGKLIEAYIKGSHCEEAVKDLVKFIRRDPPVRPSTRLILSNYNIVDTDLLELLVLQYQDKKLSFWIVALLCVLTQPPHSQLNPQEKETLEGSLRRYKLAFTKHECWQSLVMHLADYFKTPAAERTRPHSQMVEFIVMLLRNLLEVPTSSDHLALHQHLILCFLREDILSPILYIVQTQQKSALIRKIDISLLHILTLILTSLPPTALYPLNDKPKTFPISSIRKGGSTRHSRFMPNFKVRASTGVQKVVHQLGADPDTPHDKQRKAPVRLADEKGVEKIENETLSSNFLGMEIEVEGGKKKVIQIGSEVAREFLDVEFEQICGLVFDDLFRETGKVSQHDLKQYLQLCGWALRVVKAKYAQQKAQTTPGAPAEITFHWVVHAMQPPHFELIYKLLLREATRPKKKQFQVNLFHGALSLLEAYLGVVEDMGSSMNISDRKNANVLMGNLFRHDVARVLRVGFHWTNHPTITNRLITTTHIFFRLLTHYADGKVLTIRTNKLLKRHKGNRQQTEQLEEAGFSDEEAQPMQEREDEERYQERKYNEKSEFAILAEYGVVGRYVSILKGEGYKTKDEEVVSGVFYYMGQVRRLLGGEWLFWQAETLQALQKVLADGDWCRQNRNHARLTRQICSGFIRLLTRNPLALMQCLFKFPSASLQQQISQNYPHLSMPDYEPPQPHSESQDNLFPVE